MEDDIIYVKNLSKTFKESKVPALNNISLNLKKGELAALVGPDGAGKTTFLRILCGLLKPDFSTNVEDRGEVLIDGISPFDADGMMTMKKSIGYMPQKFGLYEDLTVIENLNLFVSLNGAKGDSASLILFLNLQGLRILKKGLQEIFQAA